MLEAVFRCPGHALTQTDCRLRTDAWAVAAVNTVSVGNGEDEVRERTDNFSLHRQIKILSDVVRITNLS